MRVAIIYRPKNPAPPESVPTLMGGLGQWVERHSKRFSTLEFFATGGGLAVGDVDESAELIGILAENPFTTYMDVEILPVVDPGTAIATFGEVFAALADAGQHAR